MHIQIEISILNWNIQLFSLKKFHLCYTAIMVRALMYKVNHNKQIIQIQNLNVVYFGTLTEQFEFVFCVHDFPSTI